MTDEQNDTGIDLDDPLTILWRRLRLEELARRSGSTTRCPECNTLLPYSRMHCVGAKRWFCSICQIYFDKDSDRVSVTVSRDDGTIDRYSVRRVTPESTVPTVDARTTDTSDPTREEA